MKPIDDPNHPNNSVKHHTGKLCIKGCGRPAGTFWNSQLCQVCNAIRVSRITAQLEGIMDSFDNKPRAAFRRGGAERRGGRC